MYLNVLSVGCSFIVSVDIALKGNFINRKPWRDLKGVLCTEMSCRLLVYCYYHYHFHCCVSCYWLERRAAIERRLISFYFSHYLYELVLA
jgi:hypothetical protein